MRAWTPSPIAGDMKICVSCLHRRDDRRRTYRCGLASHGPYLPPLVAWKPAGDPSGAEVCGEYEPSLGPDMGGRQLALEAPTQ